MLSGCGTLPSTPKPFQPARYPVILTEYELNHFQIDCDNKKEQVEFLQGQRRTKAEVINSWLKLPFNGFQPVLSERRNWLIDHNLTDLRNLCYDRYE